jgi:OmcA/MtrC family decaheme c-type cytochrome
MQTGWRGIAFVGAVGALLAAAAGGCGSSRNNDDPGGGGGLPPGGATTASELNLEIQSADAPASGAPSVTFRATDTTGAPVDVLAELQRVAPAAPRLSALRFTLSQLKDSGEYVDAFEATATGKPFDPGTGAVQPALTTATQAGFDQITGTSADLATRLTSQGNGVYRFQLAAPQRTDLDRTKTWTAGMWATRTVGEGDAGVGHPDGATLNFVPAGGTATRREVVADAACNTCHGRLEAHDRRTGTQLCLTCHSPQTTDPESGNTVDFKVMVHKIHRGAGLPSVRAGAPYRIVGFAANDPATLPASAVHDFSDVNFPRPVTDCATCHQGAQAASWNTNPSLAACASCHDNVRFDSSAPGIACDPAVTAPCNHTGGPQQPTSSCAGCHGPQAIQAVHVNPLTAQAGKFQYEIVSLTVPADRKPVVQFRVTDPTNAGRPYVFNANGGGAPDPAWIATAATPPQSGASRLFVDVAWPSTDYTNLGSGQSYGQPVQINALTDAQPVAGQAGVWQVVSPVAIPAEVTAGSVAAVLEGHPAWENPPGTFARVPVTNAVAYAGLTGGAGTPRREVVSVDRCNACHGQLSAHGSNRTGRVDVCTVCHNPNATDKGRRPAGVEGEEPIDLKAMIHGIHAVGLREEFTIYGFGGTPHTFPIGTGNVSNCNVCHVNDSWRIPLQAAVQDTTLSTGADAANPADNTRRPKTTAVCISCHSAALPHAEQNGGAPGGTETCQACHGPGGVRDISQFHPIVAPQ